MKCSFCDYDRTLGGHEIDFPVNKDHGLNICETCLTNGEFVSMITKNQDQKKPPKGYIDYNGHTIIFSEIERRHEGTLYFKSGNQMEIGGNLGEISFVKFCRLFREWLDYQDEILQPQALRESFKIDPEYLKKIESSVAKDIEYFKKNPYARSIEL